MLKKVGEIGVVVFDVDLVGVDLFMLFDLVEIGVVKKVVEWLCFVEIVGCINELYCVVFYFYEFVFELYSFYYMGKDKLELCFV